MAWDEEDLRYLLEVKATFRKSLERETEPEEISRLQAFIDDINCRILEGRISPPQKRLMGNDTPPRFSVGQTVKIIVNGDLARILDVKYTGNEWLYFVGVPSDPPWVYKDWFGESQLSVS